MIDYKKVFSLLPAMYVTVLPDSPNYTVVAVTDSYLSAVNLKREDMMGRPLFAHFTERPQEGETGKLFRSLEIIRITKTQHSPELLRFDIGGQNKYWSSQNIPVVEEDGSLLYIIHAPIEITHLVKMGLKIS